MSTISDILRGIERGRAQFEMAMANLDYNTGYDDATNGSVVEMTPERHEDRFGCEEKHVYDESCIRSELALGDNLEYMKWLLLNNYGGRFKVMYIDPPFFTKSKYNATVSVRGEDGKKHTVHHLAYDDRFDRNLEYYIENMTIRLLMMKELLADDGLMWIHLDWHSSHYIKLVMDELMGEKNFVNEIIWSYKSGGSGKRHFSRKHDTLLVYSRTKDYYIDIPLEKSYNRGLKPYHFKGVDEYKDDYGWYTLVNMKDVWTIDMVGRTSRERTGYATQKPIELMKRIIESGSHEGDLVGDMFCGSGSFLEAAQSLGRKWIGCDCEELAAAMAKKRLDLIESNYLYRADRTRIYRPDRFQVVLKQKEELENGKSFFCCSAHVFTPDIEMGYIQMNDRKYVDDALSKDTMQFIDYIMIDPDYRDNFSCEIVVEKDFDNLRFISEGNAAIVAVDVFGKEYFTRL